MTPESPPNSQDPEKIYCIQFANSDEKNTKETNLI